MSVYIDLCLSLPPCIFTHRFQLLQDPGVCIYVDVCLSMDPCIFMHRCFSFHLGVCVHADVYKWIQVCWCTNV